MKLRDCDFRNPTRERGRLSHKKTPVFEVVRVLQTQNFLPSPASSLTRRVTIELAIESRSSHITVDGTSRPGEGRC